MKRPGTRAAGPGPDVKTAVAELRRLANPKVRIGMTRYGLPGTATGCDGRGSAGG
jgi:hypothetical protein